MNLRGSAEIRVGLHSGYTTPNQKVIYFGYPNNSMIVDNVIRGSLSEMIGEHVVTKHKSKYKKRHRSKLLV